MTMRARRLLRVAALVVLLAAIAQPLRAAEPTVPIAVDAVLTVAVRDVPQLIAAEGVVEAVRQATLGAQIAGRIIEFRVKAGDSVRAGQVLARIDARDRKSVV